MNLKAIRNGTGSLNFLDFAATAAILSHGHLLYSNLKCGEK